MEVLRKLQVTRYVRLTSTLESIYNRRKRTRYLTNADILYYLTLDTSQHVVCHLPRSPPQFPSSFRLAPRVRAQVGSVGKVLVHLFLGKCCRIRTLPFVKVKQCFRNGFAYVVEGVFPILAKIES